MSTLTGRRILIASTSWGTESDEIRVPLERLGAAGAQVTVATPEGKPVKTLKLDEDPGPEVPADTTLADVDASDFDAIVLPGGTINSDQLRTDEDALGLIKAISAAGKPVAAICHAPWALIDAGLVESRSLTSVPTISTDLKNAGARWSDEEVVVDKGDFTLITSRTPEDLDAFIGAITDALS